jgi:hypothetical protein
MNAPGFIVELFEGGPWLAQDGGVAIEWRDRGVWPTEEEAQIASLSALGLSNLPAAPGEAHVNQGPSNEGHFCGAMHSRRGAAGRSGS